MSRTALEPNQIKQFHHLSEIGHLLKKTREGQFMSIQQLSNRTLISISRIEAIEAGQVYLLEETNIHQVVRRLGNALGLNGVNLATSLAELPSTSESAKLASPEVKEDTKNDFQREEQLQEIGRLLKEVREAHSVSLEELKARTFVPKERIRAIEAGIIRDPQEDIYLRGLIRRLGNSLGLDGVSLALSLPKP